MKSTFSILVLIGALVVISIGTAEALQPRRGGQGVSDPGGVHKCHKVGMTRCGWGWHPGCQPQPIYSCN
ncbi:MAG TPA: hypothetical protein VKX28_14820 [Xanthobacteraceae bacterium]|nr:hypothetical protein [Xanthobacteraceae bacterium]